MAQTEAGLELTTRLSKEKLLTVQTASGKELIEHLCLQLSTIEI